MARDSCDTGRRIYSNKKAAEQASAKGKAESCPRCRGYHAAEDRPRSRRRRR